MTQTNKTEKNTSKQRESGKTQKYQGGVTKGENNKGGRDGIGLEEQVVQGSLRARARM